MTMVFSINTYPYTHSKHGETLHHCHCSSRKGIIQIVDPGKVLQRVYVDTSGKFLKIEIL